MEALKPEQRENKPEDRSVIWIAAGVFLGLYLAWLVSGGNFGSERFIIGSLTLIFSSLVAAILALWGRKRFTQARLRDAWNWLCAGLVIWLAGDLGRFVIQFISPNLVKHANIVDGIYLAGSLALWVGLLRYPRQNRQLSSRLHLLLDATIVVTAFLTLAWIILFQPMISVFFSNNQINSLAVIYPVVDLLLLLSVIALFLFSEPRGIATAFSWITLGLVFYAISDLSFAFLTLINGYHPGSLVDAGWVGGDACLVVALIYQIKSENKTSSEHGGLTTGRLLVRIQNLLPFFAPLILGLYSLMQWMLLGQLNLLGLWVTVALGLAIIARQGMLTGEIGMQQYANLVNNVAEPTFICDARGQLRLVNPALLDATGYSLQDVLGLKLTGLIHPPEMCPQLLSEGLKGGWSGEIELRRRDETLIPVSVSLRPILPAGDQRLALAVTAHDLSEQKKQQEALQKAYEEIAAAHTELERFNSQLKEKVAQETASLSQAYAQLEEQNKALQSLDSLKTDFVSMVSHELRAPLTNIMGGLELVLSKSDQMGEPDVQTLELVQTEILRLRGFVETILDLSALDAGRTPLNPVPIELDVQVRLLQKQMVHLESTQRIHWQIPDGLPPVLADGQAVNSILFHLLDNALKYAPEGVIIVSAGQTDQRIWVRVEDDGPGLPPEAQTHLFERFYRYNPTDSQSVYGHGLGLYIVHRLLEAMNGEINFVNRPQGGACFTIQLPSVEP